jgi:hypothetical protein
MKYSSTAAAAAGKRNARFAAKTVATHAWISYDGTYIIREKPIQKRKRIVSPKSILKKPKYSRSKDGTALQLQVLLSKFTNQLNTKEDFMARLHQASEKTRQSRRALMFAGGRDIVCKAQQSWQQTITSTNLLGNKMWQRNHDSNERHAHSSTPSIPQTAERKNKNNSGSSNNNNNYNNLLALLEVATALRSCCAA